MGEEWTELVWTSISLIALSIVLVIAFNFMQLGKTLTNEVYQDQAVVEQRQEIRNFLPYDETVLSGSEAFSAALDISSKGYFAIIACENVNRLPGATKSKTFAVIYHPSCNLSDSTVNAQVRAQITTATNTFAVDSINQRIRNAPAYSYCVSNVAGTARDYQNIMDEVARTAAQSSTITFNDFSFKSHIIYDKLGTPMGIVMIRLRNGVEVIRV